MALAPFAKVFPVNFCAGKGEAPNFLVGEASNTCARSNYYMCECVCMAQLMKGGGKSELLSMNKVNRNV